MNTNDVASQAGLAALRNCFTLEAQLKYATAHWNNISLQPNSPSFLLF